MKYYTVFIAGLLACLLGASSAHASIIQWNLDNVTGDGGESVTGYIDYNTSLNDVSSFSLTATGPLSENLAGDPAIVTDGAFTILFPIGRLVLQGPGSSNSIFAGTSDITLASGSAIASLFPVNTSIPLSGTLDYAGPVSAVPLPAPLPLLLAAIMGLGIFSAYRRQRLLSPR